MTPTAVSCMSALLSHLDQLGRDEGCRRVTRALLHDVVLAVRAEERDMIETQETAGHDLMTDHPTPSTPEDVLRAIGKAAQRVCDAATSAMATIDQDCGWLRQKISAPPDGAERPGGLARAHAMINARIGADSAVREIDDRVQMLITRFDLCREQRDIVMKQLDVLREQVNDADVARDEALARLFKIRGALGEDPEGL